MSTAVAILEHYQLNFEQLDNINRRVAYPSKFRILGRNINKATQNIQENWFDLSEGDRQKLRDIAYELVEPDRDNINLFDRALALFLVIIIKITGQEKDLMYCVEALDDFVDTILDAIEREDSSYQETLSDIVEEVSSNLQGGEIIDAKRQRQWLRELSDQGLVG
ncbi:MULTISPECIES: hypothetical protein [Spirulina sp. CCY15215]|uniref:hypothetical protein n=1 Tax=Spirulina sp. CCY15215 TaxID=2767591 RepID=UPI00194F5241|nr:hypothetical protein [Spirulina major]